MQCFETVRDMPSNREWPLPLKISGHRPSCLSISQVLGRTRLFERGKASSNVMHPEGEEEVHAATSQKVFVAW